MIKPESTMPAPKMQKAFDRGKAIHYQIEARFPAFNKEAASTFCDPSLPFDIIYHPDIYDASHGIIYEVKPSIWFINNLDYCVAQGSGYKHFHGAKKLVFLLYGYTEDGKVVGPWPYDAPFTFPWEQLRTWVLASDEMLGEAEAAKS